MAYGIRFSTPNGDVQIDSDTPNSGLIVIDSGTGGSISNVDLNNDWIFARPTNRSSGSSQISMRNTSGSNYSFYAYNNLAISSVQWIRARWANVNTAAAGGYGILIMNSDGDIAFDSNRLTGDGGVGITAHFPTGSGLGGSPTQLTTTPLTTDRNQYVLMNNAINTYTDANNFTYTGFHWQNSTSSSVGRGIHWVGFTSFEITTLAGTIAQTFPVLSPDVFFAEGGSV